MKRNISKEDILKMLPSYQLLIKNNNQYKLIVGLLSKFDENSTEAMNLYNELEKLFEKEQVIRINLRKESENVANVLLHPLSDYDKCDENDVFNMYINDMQDLDNYAVAGIIDSYIFEQIGGILYNELIQHSHQITGMTRKLSKHK